MRPLSKRGGVEPSAPFGLVSMALMIFCLFVLYKVVKPDCPFA